MGGLLIERRIAGSETTATTLATVTCYLLKNPDMLRKLQEEVRSSFSSFDQININSAARLKYVQAVCLEALRVFPPLPLGLPRVVPKDGEVVDGHFVDGGVSLDDRLAGSNSLIIESHSTLSARTLSQRQCPQPTSKTRGPLIQAAG